jgi:hypothetical protein
LGLGVRVCALARLPWLGLGLGSGLRLACSPTPERVCCSLVARESSSHSRVVTASSECCSRSRVVRAITACEHSRCTRRGPACLGVRVGARVEG